MLAINGCFPTSSIVRVNSYMASTSTGSSQSIVNAISSWVHRTLSFSPKQIEQKKSIEGVCHTPLTYNIYYNMCKPHLNHLSVLWVVYYKSFTSLNIKHHLISLYNLYIYNMHASPYKINQSFPTTLIGNPCRCCFIQQARSWSGLLNSGLVLPRLDPETLGGENV